MSAIVVRSKESCPATDGRWTELFQSVPLPGGSGDVGGDDVGGVPVEAAADPVGPHRGSRIGVRRGFLDVAQQDGRVVSGSAGPGPDQPSWAWRPALSQ
jgi:hypothetical protein